eukprot:s1914_g7.t2
MPKKPVLVTLEEFEELKTQLQGRIDGVLKELRTKVPGCEDRIAELQIAKTKLAQDVEVAITATKRVGDDAQATTTNMVGELDSRLSAKVADLLAQLQHSDEALTRDLTTSEGETRKLLADELTALCERLDQELSLVRREMAESMQRAAGDIRAEMQKLSASLSANIAESQQQSLDNASGLKAYREHTDAVLHREQKARTLEEERVKVAEADIWMRLDRLSELVQEVGDSAMEEVRVTTGEMDHKITQAITSADQRLTFGLHGTKMSSVDAVLLQFGLGAAALVLRYFSRPFVYCCQRCTACIWNCLCCLCIYRKRAASLEEGVEEPSPSRCLQLKRFLFTHAAVRWYWFHLAIQLGFLSREYQVISVASQGVWPSEVLLSYSALWLTYAVVFVEVCHFSSVRNRDVVTKITVDGLLDMLLLPVNIGFFGHLCVRKLALQSDGHSLHIISTIMESSEIWEAWALWSVLGLFVTVVDVESRRDPAHREFAVPFRNLSLQGVRTWVFMIIIITATRLVMIGVLQSRAPTLCFWASKTCTSCNELYDQNIHLAAGAVNFILCSFALAFVFTFEHSFDQYLSKIGPFWKFWGVKGVVSVTYFQWLVLTYGPLNLDDKRIYELHCLLCTVEMPVLAVLHATCAYPYGKPWLNYLLQLQQQDMSEQEAITERTSRFRFTEFNVDFTISTRSCGPETWVLLFYGLFWSLGCFASHEFVVFLIPVAHEVQGPQPPMYYATCNAEGDIAHFLAGSELHFQIRNDTVEKHRLPGVAGAWLPLCGKAALDCEPGFHGMPSLRCSPRGRYEPTGLCKPIRCGQPGEEVGHARLHKSDLVIREWTSDMVISYECIRGFVGKIRAKCGMEGSWTFTGECTEVLCPDPPTVARAKPLLEPSELQNRTWQAGMSLRYQCIDPFVGIITARCEDDGNFVLHGRCLAFCKTPPAVPNAIADYNNSVAGIGWSEGMRVKYDCSPGWSGTVFATCREDGQYSIEGVCKAQCPDLNKILEDSYGASWADVISVNRSHSLDLTGSGEADIVALACAPGLTGLPFAACQEGSWQILGSRCRSFRTSTGCSCKRQWKFCNDVLQRHCIRWNGCHGSSAQRYGWCEVDDKLPCASASTPRWDYCVGQGPQDDPEVPLESEMGAVLLRYGLFVVAGLLSLAALLFLRHYLPVLDESCTRLKAGLCEVQNAATRRVTWVLRKASEKLRPPLLDDVKIQPHVSWFSPLFDAGGCHGLQLELQIFRVVDPPLEGQEVGDCAVYLWATKGCNLVYKLAVGSKSQLLEKKFNGRVPYGTTRLCFFTDQISKEDDTLRVSCEVLETLRELEAPVQPAAPQPPDWRKSLLAEGKPVPEVDAVVAASRDQGGPEPLEGQLLYSMHINNRLLDLVKDQVETMKCRMVRTVEWRIEHASLLRQCFPEGEAMCSTDFGAAGIEGLRLVFYPSGYRGATEGFCSLFLVAPAGATLQCTLQAGRERREASHVYEREGAFGRTNFCQLESCVDEHDSIYIRLEVAEAHQDLVAKAAHPAPKPGDQRTLSQQEGVVSGPIHSAVKLRRHVGNHLEANS